MCNGMRCNRLSKYVYVCALCNWLVIITCRKHLTSGSIVVSLCNNQIKLAPYRH